MFRSLILAVGLSATFLGESFAQPATTTNFTTGFFNTGQGWKSGALIQGQNTNDPALQRWQGNDPVVVIGTNEVGGTDYIALAAGYTAPGAGNRSFIQGGLNAPDGYIPNTNNVRLWRHFTPSATSLQDTVTFLAEWSLIGSLIPEYPNLDTFSFDLRTTNNAASLIKFDLTPGIAVLSNAYTLQSVVGTNAPVSRIDLGYQGLYQMEVSLTGATYDLKVRQLNAATRAVLTNWSLVSGAALAPGLSALNFGTVSVDWELTSPNPANPGSNYMVANQFFVTTTAEPIPEPGTWAAAALLLGGAVHRLISRRSFSVRNHTST